MARAAVAAGEALRVRVDEFRFAARDRRAFAVGDARVDRQRRGLRLAAELDRVLDRQVPRVVEIEVGPALARAAPDRRVPPPDPPPCSARSRAPCRRSARIASSEKSAVLALPRRWPTYTVTLMPLSRLYAIVSTSSLRTVTLWPMPCETSVSAAVAPPRLRGVEHRRRRCARARRSRRESDGRARHAERRRQARGGSSSHGVDGLTASRQAP